MATLKTYGIYGMVEKHAILEHRGVRLHVSFTGGSATSNGVTPARYRTAEPFYQFIIENSKEFKSGYIKLLSGAPLRGVADGGKAKGAVESGDAAGGSAAGGLEDVSVSDLEGEGKRYLMERFGVKSGQLRSIRQIILEAERRGVRFVLPGQQ